jgi:hypothetical protein
MRRLRGRRAAAFGRSFEAPRWRLLAGCGLCRGVIWRAGSLDLAAPAVVVGVLLLCQVEQLQDNPVNVFERYRIGSNEIEEETSVSFVSVVFAYAAYRKSGADGC